MTMPSGRSGAERHGVREAFGMQFACPPGYLNTASIGIPSAAAADAMVDAIGRWRTGDAQPAEYDAPVHAAREAFASLCGVPLSTVTIGGSLSALVGLVAAAVPTGTRVLTVEREFTSVTFPFAAQSARGVTVDEVSVNQLADRAEDYDVVAVSAVQSSDGALVDLPALRASVEGSKTRVILDVTQAAGWLPLELDWVDAVVCTGYKWLLSPRGAAWMSVRPDFAYELIPTAANWYAGESRWDSIYGLPLRLAADNRRLDTSPAWFSHLGAAAVVPQLAELDVRLIRDHCVSLADAFRAEFDLPPAGSAIVSIGMPSAAERLARAGVTAAVRAGAARLSFHLYNDSNDLDRAVGALRDTSWKEGHSWPND